MIRALITIVGSVIFVLVLIDVAAKKVGVSFPTGLEVFRELAVVSLVMIAIIFWANRAGVSLIPVIPVSFVAYLYCWLPALNYYFGDIGIFANGWIQIVIAIVIMGCGHWLIYRLKLFTPCLRK